MAKAGAGRAQARVVTAQSWLRQDDCGGSATARLCDAVAGTPGRRHWATQGTKAAAVGAPGHGCGWNASSGNEGEEVDCEVVLLANPSPV